MRAALDYYTTVQHNDLVGFLNRRKTVRDNQRGAFVLRALYEFVESSLYDALALVVLCGGVCLCACGHE